jgi:hypothetical protein
MALLQASFSAQMPVNGFDSMPHRIEASLNNRHLAERPNP